ncbi:MAG TPA: saccharopine dehydrogenase NADP-binding domain-containing protein, partial [Limnochorda sp.]
RLEALAAACPPGKAEPVLLDVQDPSSLRSAMAGWDVVASALGPAYLCEVPALRAAIEAGVPYVSICDDYDAAQAALALNQAARDRGLTMVTGLGWTPGLSNLLAKQAAARLDKPQRIHIAWAGAAGDAQGYAVILHTLHILTGRVPTFQAGRFRLVQAGSGAEVLPFPSPLGPVRVAHVGHPEPVTLPRAFPGVDEVTLKGGLAEPFINWLSIVTTRTGLTRSPRGKAVLGRIFRPLLPFLQRIGPKKIPASGLHVRVEGLLDGEPARVTVRAVGSMADLTSVPLAVGALLLGQGAVKLPGVHAPEAPGLFDAERFVQELKARGLTIEDPVVERLPAPEPQAPQASRGQGA